MSEIADTTELQEINQYDSEDRKKYISETAFDTQAIGMDNTFELGTLEITESLAKQAALAIKERVDATMQYTKDRVERINRNYDIYNQIEFDSDSDNQIVFPETTIAIEDWRDDLFTIFENFEEEVEVRDDTNSIKHTISAMLDVDPDEGDRKTGIIRSIIRGISELPTQDIFAEAGKEGLVEYIKNTFNFFIKERDLYQFRKGDLIKTFIKRIFRKSGLKDKNENGMLNLDFFFKQGLISGQFCFKEMWAGTRKYRLTKHKKGKQAGQYTSLGPFKYEIDTEENYKIIPKDTRQLIFRKDKIDWVIEKIDTRYSDILNLTLDEKGKPKKNAIYDHAQLKKIEDVLKKNPMTQTNKDRSEIEVQSSVGTAKDDPLFDDIFELEADIKIYEGHHIPLKIDDRVELCLITSIRIDDQYYPIRIQETPYFELPYKFANFTEKDGDVAGVGLPELNELLQSAMNTLWQFSIDMLNMSIWGIMAVDEDSVQDPEDLNNINPKEPIRLKNMNGRKMSDVIMWYTPPVEILGTVISFFEQITSVSKRLVRKGPAGEKITPNPTATEATSIIQEKLKSVNRVATDLNLLFERAAKNGYIYNILNREESMKLRTNAIRITSPEEKKVRELVEDSIFDELEKTVEVTPDQLFVDGLEFRIEVIKNANRQAVEKQQALQSLELMNQVALNAQTGQPEVFEDETGAKVIVDRHRIISNIFRLFDQDSIWKKAPQEIQAQVLPPQTQGPGPSPGTTIPQAQVPDLSAAPVEANILGGVQNL